VFRIPIRRTVLSLSAIAALAAPTMHQTLAPSVIPVADRAFCGKYPRVAARNDCWVVRNEPIAVRWRNKHVARCIRHWESGHNYQAVSPRGSFRGAYQFSQSTFDSVGPDRLDGIPANRAPKYLQDLKARKLYRERGLQPWPTPHRKCS